MSVNISTNMNLPIPGVGSEAGPDYATDVNNCLTLVDQHNHAAGYGVQITPDGLNLNSDVSFLSNNAVDLRSLRVNSQGSVLVLATDVNCFYSVLGDAYFNDAAGNNIRLTQNGAVAGTPGSIANLVSPASASYVSASSTFVFQSDTNTPANIDGGAFIFRNVSASSNGITIQPPNSLSSSYTLTLPALPASTLPMTLSSSGTISTGLIQNAQTQGSSLVPSGAVMPYFGTSAPTGWLLCDGSAVSRTTYAVLFAIIGTSSGSGDGSTTFNLPDTRGLFLRGVDGSAGRDPDSASRTAIASGGNTGNNVGSYEADAFASHNHTASFTNDTGTGGSTRFIGTALGGGVQNGQSATAILATGGSETRPKNIYANFIIKT